jgi:hypothetical protein
MAIGQEEISVIINILCLLKTSYLYTHIHIYRITDIHYIYICIYTYTYMHKTHRIWLFKVALNQQIDSHSLGGIICGFLGNV